MAQDWQTAYFRQAQADYDTFLLLEKSGAAFCQRLHFLQMTTEKLAKGFASAPGGPPQPKVHRGYAQFLQQVKRRPELQTLFPGNTRQVTPYVDALLPYARLIEDLAPANANNGPNAEYPWQTPTGVIAPVDYAFSNLEFDARGMLNMLKFIRRCFEIIVEE